MKRQIAIGQQYQAVGRATMVWEVAKIVEQGGIPHARLVSMDNFRDTRLVACSILLDPARYRLLHAVRTEVE